MRSIRWSWGLYFATGLVLIACDDSPEDPADMAVAVDVGRAVDDPDAAPVSPPCFQDIDCPQATYCLVDLLEGACVEGCRQEPDSCGDVSLCNDERVCVRDLSCVDDTDCLEAEYCNPDAVCADGCRTEPDSCGFGEDGVERLCDPQTRSCEAAVACCTDDFECTMARAEGCERPAIDATSCAPNPCLPTNTCERNRDCADDRYCADDGSCRLGCRVLRRDSCLNTFCDPDSHTLQACACEVDTDCANDLYCDPERLECAYGCRVEPDNCADELFCVGRQCGGCSEDADCAERLGDAWYCQDGACQEACVSHDDCAEGEACTDGACLLGCRDDAQEDDDRANDATPIELDGFEIWDGEALGSRACPGDVDWYRVEVPVAEQILRVRVEFSHERGDLDARLRSPGGVLIAGDSVDDDEIFEVRGAEAGAWTLEVYSRGLAENDYLVSAQLVAGGCQPDGSDPGDDRSAGAGALSFSADGVADVDGRGICVGDVDWYSLELGQRDGMNIRLYLLGNPQDALDELDFAVFGPGQPVAGDRPSFVPSAMGGGGDQPVWIELSAARGNVQVQDGTYYIRVGALDQRQRGAYRLTVTLDRFRALCRPDSAEANETSNTAFDLLTVPALVRDAFDGGLELRTEGLFEGRSLCSGDEDWYRFPLAAEDGLTAMIVRPAEALEGDVVLRLLDEQLRVVDESRTAQAESTVRLRGAAGGRYYLQITAPAAETSTDYSLWFDRVTAPVECGADRLEPNDGRADAAELNAPVEVDDLTLCGEDGDADWFHFRTDAQADITVSLSFQNAQSNLELDVFSGDEQVQENVNGVAGHSDSDDEQVRLPGRLAGDWWVRVSAVDGGAARYALDVQVAERDFICPGDPDEPNDTLQLATALGGEPFVREGQWLCERVPSESDWFSVSVPENTGRAVAASFVFGDDGDLVLEAYSEDGVLLASTVDVARINSKQCLSVPPGPARTLLFRVVPLTINQLLEDDERLDYTLTVADGADCEAISPATPGVLWPSVN